MALLTGRGRYIDDLGVRPDTLHAAILRSSHAHAEIRAIRAEAARRAVRVRYPRNSCTLIETYGVMAEYDPGADAYDILANFPGPFSLHPVMARALKVPGNRLRLRTPADSGGSFGVKQHRGCGARASDEPQDYSGQGSTPTS